MSLRSICRAWLAAALAVALCATEALAHGTLKRSSPAAGDTLRIAPRTLRLEFTEAPELAVSSIQLAHERGAIVGLGPLRAVEDSARILLADVPGRLAPGRYVVRWQIAGRDGHPVRGEFAFVVAPPPAAVGMNPQPIVDGPRPSTRPPEPVPPDWSADPSFTSASAAYVVVRWVQFLGLLGVIGAVAFHFLVLGAARRGGEPAPVLADADARALRVGGVATLLLAVSAVARLLAQWSAMRAAAVAPSAVPLAPLLTATTWGHGWLLELAALAVLAAGLLVARRDGRTGAGWALVALGTAVVSLVPALSGHAAVWGGALAAGLDAVHVVAAGGWMGGLLVLLVAGLPAARALPEPARTRTAAALVNAFSPTALVFAGLVVATGALATLRNVGSVGALLHSPYGQMLLRKLFFLGVAVAVGSYNWRRARPMLARSGDDRAIRRAMRAELAAGAAILLVTAILVAMRTPVSLVRMR